MWFIAIAHICYIIEKSPYLLWELMANVLDFKICKNLGRFSISDDKANKSVFCKKLAWRSVYLLGAGTVGA
jgi:hypothetical protein